MYYIGMGSIVLESTELADIMNEWLRGLNRPSSTVLVAGMLVLGPQEAGYCMGRDFELVGGDTEYELIDFDSNQTRAYAQGLVNLGDPVWGEAFRYCRRRERRSIIKTNFSNSGLPSTLEEFEVPLYYMGNSFELMICNSGTLGGVFGGPTPVRLQILIEKRRTSSIPWTSLYRGTAEA